MLHSSFQEAMPFPSEMTRCTILQGRISAFQVLRIAIRTVELFQFDVYSELRTDFLENVLSLQLQFSKLRRR